MQTYKLTVKNISLADVEKITSQKTKLALSKSAEIAVAKCARAVEEIIRRKKIVYGVNTGIGDLCDVVLEDEHKLKNLQENIILSHACGCAPYLAECIAHGAFFLVINSRAKGYSGLRPETLKKLIALYNAGVSPLLPVQGSLGASGDLIPLAHLALMLLGKGSVYEKGKVRSAASVLKKLGMAKHEFSPKEALSLINGTEVTASAAAFVALGAKNLILSSLRATAALFEVLGASRSGLDARLHELKPHVGQKTAAQLLRAYVKGSNMCDDPRKVQDSYVIRCAPQIDGAILDRINEAERTIETELNSVTDNPLFFFDGARISALSGGNFHAQSVAFAMDSVGIALAAFGKVGERRIERLMNSSLSGLLPFLVHDGGVNSGLMITHYLAASLVAENGVLAHPASVQSIAVSANQEDFVSMSMTAANKALQILKNCEKILAIETVAIVQAMDVLMIEHKTAMESFSESAQKMYDMVRARVPHLHKDRWMSEEIEIVAEMIKNGKFR